MTLHLHDNILPAANCKAPALRLKKEHTQSLPWVPGGCLCTGVSGEKIMVKYVLYGTAIKVCILAAWDIHAHHVRLALTSKVKERTP